MQKRTEFAQIIGIINKFSHAGKSIRYIGRKRQYNMSKKNKDSNHEDHPFSNEDYYSTLDITSATEMTGAAMRPPLTDAEAENYGDIISMPQQRATHADGKDQKKCKREDKL